MSIYYHKIRFYVKHKIQINQLNRKVVYNLNNLTKKVGYKYTLSVLPIDKVCTLSQQLTVV